MADIITKDVLTLDEIKTVIGQEKKAMVIYDVSTGAPNGLDVEVLIGMNSSINTLLSEDVSINGVKEFIESPIVPDATTIHQAASLGQVSNLINGEEWYGVQWDTTVADSALTRIGKMTLHQSLPIQSGMRRCLLADDGTVNYYLSPSNSLLLDNGAPSDLTGAGGQVMVEIPAHYEKFETEGTVNRCKISLYALTGYTYIPKMYISAYEASLQRSTSKLSSVSNLTTDYRGGDNTATWDASTNTLLGRPVTNLSLTTFRTYARNRGSVNWNCNVYITHKVVYWLYVVEYANFNCQLAYNAALTAEGYRQGGLGNGVTDIDGTKWGNFNGYNPFVPCGHTNLLGNTTGIVAYAMPTEYNATIFTTYVPSYRGIENPFGHVWKWTDGCKCNIQAADSGELSMFYICDNPANYQDSNYTNYTLRGALSRDYGYVKSLIVGEFGELMPLTVGGSSTTYMCDYFYTSIPDLGVSQRGVIFGGSANYGVIAGFSCAATDSAPSRAISIIGSRLCFLN
jgi:hypothetical protein